MNCVAYSKTSGAKCTNSPALGIALIGAGAISNVHASIITESKSALLVGVFDQNTKRTTELSARYHTRAYNSLDELLSDPCVDVVELLTPGGARMEPALLCAQARKHIICEKPVEVTLARIDKMIEACSSAGVQLACILNNRWNPVYQRVHSCVQSGALGRLLLGDVSVKWYREPSYYLNSSWHGTYKLDGGGALMNQSIHFIDLLQWIMGSVSEVQSYTAKNLHTYIEAEDMAVVSLRFQNGALGSIIGTTAAYPGLYDRLEIHGSKGSILIENGHIARWEVNDDPMDSQTIAALNNIHMGNFSIPAALDITPHRKQLEETFRCLLNNQPVPVDGIEARKAVALILEIYHKAGVF